MRTDATSQKVTDNKYSVGGWNRGLLLVSRITTMLVPRARNETHMTTKVVVKEEKNDADDDMIMDGVAGDEHDIEEKETADN